MAESFLASTSANKLVNSQSDPESVLIGSALQGVIVQKVQKKASKGGVEGEDVLLYG